MIVRTLSSVALFLVAAAFLMGSLTLPIIAADDRADAPDAASADIAPAKPVAKAEPKLDQKQIDQWVKDLDSDDFATREKATIELTKAGSPAVPSIEKATASDSFEQSSRAMRILASMSQSKDEADMLAANAALARLSKSDNPAVAKAATEAIESTKAKTPKDDPNVRTIQLPGGGKIQLRIQQGGIIQGVPAAGANVRATSISKTNINGVETTNVSEASGRKIKIEKNKDKKLTIKVTVTEKGKTKSYEAIDEAALKKNHPEAHKLFEKYGKGNNAAAAIRALGIQRGNIQRAVPKGQRIVPRRQMQKSIEAAQQKLEAALKQLEASKKDGEKADLDALRNQLEEAVKALKDAQGQK